jgi:hypothetical protein
VNKTWCQKWLHSISDENKYVKRRKKVERYGRKIFPILEENCA